MDTTVLVVFGLVYVGMIVGRFPALKLDRTGIALLGAIALLAARRMDARTAWNAVDVPTIGLLFGLMVVSAQFRLAGFYTHITRWLARAQVSPDRLLAASIANLIVADQAAHFGVSIGWRNHARVGVPVTLVTLAIAGAWLALVG